MDIDEFLDKEAELIENEPLEEIIPEKGAEKGEEEYTEILKKISSCISKNDFNEVEKLYSSLWIKIGEEKYTWNKDMYHSLIGLNKKLEGMLNNLSQETTEKIKVIHNLIAKARASLRQGKIESAISIHSEITSNYNKIPEVFGGEKKKLYMEHIAPFNNDIRKQVDENFLHNFDSGLSQINHLIGSVEAELQKGNVEKAAKFYASCIHSYNSLPDGFFLQKLEKSNKLLELYKELAITLEISDLKSKLKIAPVKDDSKKRHKPYGMHEHAPKIPLDIRTLQKAAHPPASKGQEPEKSAKGSLKGELVKRKLDRARFKMDMGHTKESSKDIQDALRLDPSNTEIKELLGKLNKLGIEQKTDYRENTSLISDLKQQLQQSKEKTEVKDKKIKELVQSQDKNNTHMARLEKEIKNMSSKLKEQKEDYEQALTKEEKEQEDKIKKLTADYEKKRLEINKNFKGKIVEKDRRFEHTIHEKEDAFKARITQKEREVEEAEEKAQKEKEHFRKPAPKPTLITPHHIHKKPPHIRPPHIIRPLHIETPKPLHSEITKRLKPAAKKHSNLSALEEELIKRKLNRAHFEISRGYEKKASEDLQDILRLDADNMRARKLLESLNLGKKHLSKQTLRPVHPRPPHFHKKPLHIETLQKTIHPTGSKPKPTTKKTSRMSALEEELIKRKLNRAQFEISRGYTEEAGRDIHDALRIDADNKKAKELLDSLNETEQKTPPDRRAYNVEALKREMAKGKIKKHPMAMLND